VLGFGQVQKELGKKGALVDIKVCLLLPYVNMDGKC
jgi:hypothetical protein